VLVLHLIHDLCGLHPLLIALDSPSPDLLLLPSRRQSQQSSRRNACKLCIQSILLNIPLALGYTVAIPLLNENLSMRTLRCEDHAHLYLHTWQNNSRVAAAWNNTDTLEQYRTHLKNLHDDPHVLSMLASFDGAHFTYFELY
jgi:hypothetical protein